MWLHQLQYEFSDIIHEFSQIVDIMWVNSRTSCSNQLSLSSPFHDLNSFTFPTTRCWTIYACLACLPPKWRLVWVCGNGLFNKRMTMNKKVKRILTGNDTKKRRHGLCNWTRNFNAGRRGLCSKCRVGCDPSASLVQYGGVSQNRCYCVDHQSPKTLVGVQIVEHALNTLKKLPSPHAYYSFPSYLS